MLRQRRNVFHAFAQRRQAQPEHVQAMEQVLAEQALFDTLLQRLVGRGHDAHVHRTRAVVAQALDLAVLQRAQQFGLHQQRQFAHFIQE
ncbi:hypothetical protein G6F52_014161 [Rhizopus delemar]|nr:hypothetical protein G6F52_014161 [Rhizopus delemar]